MGIPGRQVGLLFGTSVYQVKDPVALPCQDTFFSQYIAWEAIYQVAPGGVPSGSTTTTDETETETDTE